MQEALCRELGLQTPLICWHARRDDLIEFVCTLSLVTAAVGNIAHEIITLQRTEIGELEEPHASTKVGSSTMPHKRNPMMCESVLGLARLARQHAALAIDSSLNENERDWSTVQAEWAFVGESCLLAAVALDQIAPVLSGLTVNVERMRANLGLTGGLMLSEAVMMRLAQTMGRLRAHDVVHELAMTSHEDGIPFAQLLVQDPRVSSILSRSQIDQLLDPASYTGLATDMVDRVLSRLATS
ncbi:MAG: hypothetical protein H0W83_11585 [Planctomycetes bacterium]|nr:hypothetical protein [Planctomycetota bacterium]